MGYGAKESRIKVEMSVVVTPEDIDDMMVSALEGGITYWCDEAKVIGDYLGKYASEQISRGGSLWLHCIESPDDSETDVYELTPDKFLRGLKMYLEDPNKPYDIFDGSGEKELRIDCGMVDATVADMIIQYALFEDIVFG